MENKYSKGSIQKIIDTYDKNMCLGIIPYGKLGKIVEKRLFDAGFINLICFDNYNYDNIKVMSAEKINKQNGVKKYLICSDYIVTREDVAWGLIERNQIEENQIEFIWHDEEYNVLISENKKKLDFLCVGFNKCGTTSFYQWMFDSSLICTTNLKEHQFLYNITSVKNEAYINDFSNKNSCILQGGSEPMYRKIPFHVKAYYGDDIKIVFILRNPVKALYSRFKMDLKDGYYDAEKWFLKYKKVSPKMFDECSEENKSAFNYFECIKRYFHIFGEKNVKVILFEELIHDTKNQMKEIQKFIGVPEEKIESVENLKKENHSIGVAKDYNSLCLNIQMDNMKHLLMDSGISIEKLNFIQSMREQLYKFTLTEYDEPMLKETEMRLKHYYKSDIEKLEFLLERKINW